MNEPDVICSALSEHFVTVGALFSRTTVASNKDPPLETFMGTSVAVSMYLRPVTHDEVRKIIFEMKSSSAGSDSINLLVLKAAFPSISHILTSLINACFKQGKFPNCLKIARITPGLKGGNKNDLGNYRPISLLPVVSRALQKCINIRIYEHYECHKLLRPN